MTQPLRCAIVDDEPLARERLRSLLARSEVAVEVVAEAESGTRAIPLIYSERPEAVFLDVEMPGLSGFDVVDLLAPPRPLIVFVTAYDEYALRAFEAHAVDYLTKPVRAERLARTLHRLGDLQAAAEHRLRIEDLRAGRSKELLARLSVHAGNGLRVLSLDDILRIEAEEKSVLVTSRHGTHPTDFTLDELEQRLDPSRFLRIHRSHIISLGALIEVVPWFSGSCAARLSDGSLIPVARRRTAALRAALGRP